MTKRASYHGIGTMSGTSMDGLDIAFVRFEVEEDHYEWELLETAEVPFEDKWRARLMYLAEQSAETYARTHVYLGHWFGEKIKEFIDQQQIRPDFVAVHGQTIFHQPERNFTAQIGDGETIAAYLDCPLVTNFRNKDVALGGQGAPLVPLGEKYLFEGHSLFLNLGGISNLSFGETAFDICPCNGILNYCFEKAFPESEESFDRGGELAAKGKVILSLKRALDELPYYQQLPPKSLGWEWVEENFLPLLARAGDSAPEDLLCTLIEHIAFQVSQALKKVGATQVKMMVTGGGRHHLFLMERIKAHLEEVKVEVSEDFPESWIDYKEAIVFAFLGLRVMRGQPSSLASVTGAKRDVLGGSIHLPPTFSGKLL